MRILFALLFINQLALGQAVNPYKMPGNQPVSTTPSPAEMKYVTLGGVDCVVRLFEGYYDTSDDVAVNLFYPGLGTIGTPGHPLAQAVTCVGTACTFTYATSGSEDVLRSSVKLYRNAVLMGYINESGTFIGSGVSTIVTNQYQTAGGTLAFTLSTTIGVDAVTITYDYSKLFIEGPPLYFNQGDGPDADTDAKAAYGQSGIWIGVDKAVTTGNLSLATYYDGVIAAAKLLYRIDDDRINVSGLSAGGIFCQQLLTVHARASVIASAYCATQEYSNTYPWSTTLNGVGWYVAHATADGTLTNALWTQFSASTNLQHLGGDYQNIPGGGHNTGVFHDNGFDRTIAPYDWWLWYLKQNKDATVRADYFTKFAEYKAVAGNMTSKNYARQAELLIGDLTAGAPKTALLARIAAVHTTITNGGRWMYLDFGPNTANSTGNWNNINTNTTASSTANLIDDTGSNTGFGYTTVSQWTTTGTKQLQISSNRGRQRYSGFEYLANDDGAYIQNTTSTGAARFTSVTAGKSGKLRIYGYEPTANYTVLAGLSMTVEGTNKTCFVAHNSVSNFMEYSFTVDVDGVIDIAGTTTTARDCYLTVIELYIAP